MKKYALIVLLMIPTFLQSQDCKYYLNTVDPFTKIQKIETEPVLVFNWYRRLSINFARYDSVKFFCANLTLMPNNPVLFIEGNEAMLLFEDETMITLRLRSESGKLASFGQFHHNQQIPTTTFELYYRITEQDLSNMRGKKLKGIRFYTSDSYIEFRAAKSAKEFGGLGKRKKQEALNNFFVKDIDCIN